MPEQTVEAPVYKQTTFSNAIKDIEYYESQQVQAPVIEAPSEIAPLANLESTVNEVVQPDVAPVTTEQPQVLEENVSEFNIEVVGEPAVTPPVELAQPSFNLDEEIKKIDRKELLKKAGVSDFAIEMDEYLAKGGRADDYITKRGVDWTKVSDEELIKQDLKKIYTDASQQQIDRLYSKKYSQQEIDSDEDKEDGLLLMKSEARRIRDTKIAEQNSFKIPDAIIPPPSYEAEYLQWKQQQESQPALMKQLNEFYQNHEATKRLNESKRVAINLGEGVPAFNFSINNPEALNRMFVDGGETWSKLTSTQSGEPDVQKQHQIALFAYNPQKYVQDIFNYGVQIGKKKLVDEGQNAQRPQTKAQPQELNQTSYGVGKFGDKGRN